jgi:hypothetical protein
MALGFGFGFGTSGGSGSLGPGTSLDLNFVNQGMTGGLDSRITFARSSTATFTGSNGLIQTAAINQARFDYNPTTLAPLGLLIEEQRTNLATYSDQFDNAAWVKTRSSITPNTIVSPDGTLNGDKLIEDTSTNTHFTLQSTTNANATYTLSVYVKAAERTFAFVGMSDGVTALVGAYINLTTGALTTVAGGSWTGVTATSTSVGNGWWRVTLTATRGAGTTTLVQVYTSTGVGTLSYTGDGTSGIYVWGAQLEAAAFATSYIPTVASQVTRSADNAVMTGTNFSSWYNASEGTFIASSVLTRQAALASTTIFSANDGTAANYISCFYRGSGATGAVIVTSSVGQLDQTPLGVTTANTVVNIGVAYKLNNSVSCANGTVQTTDTSVTLPTVTQLQFGIYAAGVYLNGIIKQITYYPNRLSNAQLQEITG